MGKSKKNHTNKISFPEEEFYCGYCIWYKNEYCQRKEKEVFEASDASNCKYYND